MKITTEIVVFPDKWSPILMRPRRITKAESDHISLHKHHIHNDNYRNFNEKMADYYLLYLITMNFK